MTTDIDTDLVNQLDWNKDSSSLLPAIIQDSETGAILMLGYMNHAALVQTLETKKVTFFSRSKEKLWVKGETSGNFLQLVGLRTDCDQDTILITAKPDGATCHTGTYSCFGTEADMAILHTNVKPNSLDFLNTLESIIDSRFHDTPDTSYIAKLRQQGIRKIAQKVGEEGVEVALAAVCQTEEDLINEAADLMFHLAVLLRSKGLSLNDITARLKTRNGG